MTVYEFLAKLELLFGQPRNTPDASEALANEYIEILDGYDGQVYEAAARLIARHHKSRGWPTIAKCREYLLEAAGGEIPSQTPDFMSAQQQSWLRQREPHGLLRGPIAERADGEGWLQGLNELLHEHGRLPRSHETKHMIETARIVDAWANGQAGADTIRDGALVQLAKSIVERRKELGEQVFGDRR